MREVEVFSSNDDFAIDRVCAILKENNIPFIKKEDGAGSYINIAFGRSTMSKKQIIVNSEDYRKAKKWVDFLNIEEKEEETSNELKALPVDEFGNIKYSWPAKILGGMLVVFFIAFVAFWIAQIVMYLKR